MMSGCGILTNGKGTRREYGEYNLDELTVCTVDFMLLSTPINSNEVERAGAGFRVFERYGGLHNAKY